MKIGERVELMHQPFGMHPAQRVLADVELTGIIADNHRLAQEAVFRHGTPQRAFGGDADGIRRNLQLVDPETPQMGLPGRLVVEARAWLGRQAAEHRSGQRARAHVVQCRLVDDVIGMAGAQEIKEVEPALARARGEPRERIVADLRAEAIAPGVPRAGVVHRDPWRRLQACPQHSTAFGEEPVLPRDQQAHHLALGNAQANGAQLRADPFHRDLALMVLHQHETPQLRTEMPGDPARQRGYHRLPIRRQPAFPAVADDLAAEHQVLHDECLIPLEA